MKQATTKKLQKCIGRKEYLDPRTGKKESFDVVSMENKDFNFQKIWLGHLLMALDILGNRKVKVLSWLLENRNRDNQVLVSQRELAEKCGVSKQTVTTTLKALQDADAIKKVRPGVYLLNPDLIFKGGSGKRWRLLIEYKNTNVIEFPKGKMQASAMNLD